MKENKSKIIMVVTTVAFLAIGAYAFAGWGGGYGMMGWGGGPGYRADLNEEDYKKLDDQMQTFYKETEPLRQRIYEKELALRTELEKENPDSKIATDLQKELSELQSEFNQKRIEHMISIRKANPDFNKGFMGRGGRGGFGPGYCWR